MKISKRLETIANLIPTNSKIIDVGCDHALLDIYLALEKNCECIASDINKNALDQAKYNISRFHVKKVITMLTDGLEGITIEPSDIVVISGMGTLTIKDILENRVLSNRMIISTQTDFEELRRYVTSLGYKIQDEKYVEEKKKNYIIMDFVKGSANYSDEDFKFGPILKHNIHFLQNEQEKLLEIIEKIPTDDDTLIEKKQTLKELEELKKNV